MRLPFWGALVWMAAACGRSDDDIAGRLASLPPTPAEHRTGEELFRRNCGACHGMNGGGSEQGPPLVHPVYEPGHHSDQAFHLATRNGVAAHHWRFGNMPAQPQVTDAEVAAIVGYVRWVQRQAGIF